MNGKMTIQLYPPFHLTAELIKVWVPFQASSLGICCGQNGKEMGFSEYFGLPQALSF